MLANSEDKILFVSFIENETQGDLQRRKKTLTFFSFPRSAWSLRWLAQTRRTEDDARACVSGRQETGTLPYGKRIKMSQILEIKIPSDAASAFLTFSEEHMAPFSAELGPSSPLWVGWLLVPSVGLTTVPQQRMRLMKCGCVCFQWETLANSTTKGHLAEQRTCNVRSTMEISRLQTEVSFAAKTEGLAEDRAWKGFRTKQKSEHNGIYFRHMKGYVAAILKRHDFPTE